MSGVEQVINLLESHECRFIRSLTENSILWENKVGIVRSDDIFVLNNMTENAWKFWSVN
jgi:hypothetical protein